MRHLSNVKLVSEDENSWKAHDGASEFVIAKHGLSQDTHDRIKKHFANGGKVQKFDDGGSVEPDESPSYPSVSPIPLGGAPDASIQAALLAQASRPPEPAAQPSPGVQDIEQDARIARAIRGYQDANPPAAAIAQPAVETIPKAKPLAKLAVSGGRTNSADDELTAEIDQQIEARRTEADIERNKLVLQAKNTEDSNMRQQKIWDDAQVQINANQKAQDELANKISNQEIDYNRYWNNKSAPSKISGAIGLILGGIGGGMTHSPNAALGIIEKAIDRDVEQQKAELGKRQNQLSHYMQQGHRLEDAMKLATAHDLSAAEGQMRLISERYAGAELGPELQMQIAGIQQKRRALIQAAHAGSMQNALSAEELRKRRNENELLEGQKALFPGQMKIMNAFRTGAVLPNHMRVILPSELTVNVPGDKPGEFGVTSAVTKEGREKVEVAKRAVSDGLEALKRYEDLASTIGLGGTDTAKGQQAVNDLHNAYEAILQRSSAAKGAEEAKVSAGLSNPTMWLRSESGIKEQAKAFKRSLLRHARSIYETELVGGAKAAQGLIQDEAQ